MPRLSAGEYLRRHQFLKRAWADYEVVFATLGPTQQWDLHRYYKPVEDWPDELLLDYRQDISALWPSLPARAGRAFHHLQHCYERAVERTGPSPPPEAFTKAIRPYLHLFQQLDERGRIITIAAVAKPEPDLRQLAQAIVDWKPRELQPERDEAA